MISLRTITSGIGKHVGYGSRLKPQRDWFILLSLFIVLLLASLLWNLWLFSKVTNGQAIGAATSTPAAPSVNLDTVKNVFETRAAERAGFQGSYHFVDPSL